MTNSISNTVWPTVPISNGIKSLIESFFTAADDPTDKAGDTLADEIFMPAGVMVAATGTATGSTEIRESRKNAWTIVKKRKYSVKRVYIHNTDCSDLMLLGDIEMTVANGESVDMEFAARMVVRLGSTARLQSYQVWADPAPLTELLSKAGDKDTPCEIEEEARTQ